MKSKTPLPTWWPYVFIVLVWLILIPPLMHPLFFHTHDGEHMFERVVELNQTFKHSPFGSCWLPHLAEGYGLPVFYFYPPMFFYSCSFFHFFGLSDAQTFRLLFSLTLLFSGFSMYALARVAMPRAPSCVSAVAYMAAPVHMVDIYTRGAPAQCMAYIFVPLFVLYLIKSLRTKHRKDIVLAALSLAGVVLSYHLIAYMALLLSPIFLLSAPNLTKRWKSIFLIYVSVIVLGMGLCAFYWLPMLIEGRDLRLDHVLGGFAKYTGHFLFPHEIFERNWGDPNFSNVNNPLRGMMFQIGIPFLFTAAGSLLLLRNERIQRNRLLVYSFDLLMLVSTLMMFSISDFLWKTIPYLKVVIFPWRFLFFVSLAGSFLMGLLIWQCARLRLIHLGNITVVAVIVLTWYGTTCFDTEHDVELLRTTPGEIYASGSRASGAPGTEFVLDTIQTFPRDAYPEKFNFVSGRGKVKQVALWPGKYEAVIEAERSSTIQVDAFWFPGWQLSIDGQRSGYEIVPQYGTMRFELADGEHTIRLVLNNSWVRISGWIVSFAALALCGVIARWRIDHPVIKQWGAFAGFVVLGLLLFRAPWQSYAPMLQHQMPEIDQNEITYIEKSMALELYAGDIWEPNRRAEKSLIAADAALSFESSVEGRRFSARFSSNLLALEPGVYEFQMKADDSAWVVIDDHVVVKGASVGMLKDQGEIVLDEGFHRLIVYYHNVKDTGLFKLLWKPPYGEEFSPIPSEQIILPHSKSQKWNNGELQWNEILRQKP